MLTLFINDDLSLRLPLIQSTEERTTIFLYISFAVALINYVRFAKSVIWQMWVESSLHHCLCCDGALKTMACLRRLSQHRIHGYRLVYCSAQGRFRRMGRERRARGD